MMIVTRFMWAASIAALVLALAHLAVAGFLAQRAWALETLWFLGSGIALLLGSILNIMALRAMKGDRIIQTCACFCNVVVAGFFLLALPLLKAPQALIGLVLYIWLTVGVVLNSSQKYSVPDTPA
jgi:hypothetical protein